MKIMSIEKAELKALIANDFGADFEDKVEGFTRDLHKMQGAAEAYKAASEKISLQISIKIKEELESGKIEMSTAEYSIKQVMRCADFLTHMHDTTKAQIPIQSGRIDGLKTAMLVIAKSRDKELAQAEAARAALAAGEPLRGDARPSGVRPGPSQAALRKAAEKSPEEAAKATHGTLAERRAAAKVEKAAAEAAAVKAIPLHERVAAAKLAAATDALTHQEKVREPKIAAPVKIAAPGKKKAPTEKADAKPAKPKRKYTRKAKV